LIFWYGKWYLDTRAEFMKQSEDSESTKVLTGTGMEESKSSACNNFKQVSIAVSRYSIVSLAGFRQSIP